MVGVAVGVVGEGAPLPLEEPPGVRPAVVVVTADVVALELAPLVGGAVTGTAVTGLAVLAA